MDKRAQLAADLLRLSFSVQHLYGDLARERGLTPQQAQLLCVLTDRPVSMAELAALLHCEKSTLTGLVNRAEQRGLVRRTPDPGDGRSLRVALTDQGRRLAEDFHSALTNAIVEQAPSSTPDLVDRFGGNSKPREQPAPVWAEDRAVWEAFSYAAERAQEALARRVRTRAGMPPSYFELMVKLKLAPGQRLRMGELAEATRSKPSRITHAVGQLDQAGWVRRDPDPVDARSYVVTLTVEGHAAMRKARPEYTKVIRTHVLNPLSTRERRQLRALCEKILASFDTRPANERPTHPTRPGGRVHLRACSSGIRTEDE